MRKIKKGVAAFAVALAVFAVAGGAVAAPSGRRVVAPPGSSACSPAVLAGSASASGMAST